MTPRPLTIGPVDPLSLAQSLMRVHGIRHLPVTDAGRLVGIVCERELELLEAASDTDLRALSVERAMVRQTYVVGPDTALQVVAREMAERKVDSALVVHRGELVGLFTTADALRALATVLGGDATGDVLDADLRPAAAELR